MSLPCSICIHPKRAEIDAELIRMRLSLRAAACRYGVGRVSVWRHTRKHLAPLLRAARAKAELRPERLIERAMRHAARAEAFAEKAAAAQDREAFVEVGPEVRQSLRLIGEITRELAPAHQTLLIELGVQNRSELESALALARASEGLGLDEMQGAAVQLLRDVIAREPERRLAILGALGGEVSGGSTLTLATGESRPPKKNGRGNHKNGG